MELKTQVKLANHICRLLKVSFIDFPIGRTNKGNLNLKFTDNGDFEMFLDSVPLTTKDIFNDENNIELKRMIEKYWFEKETATQFYPHSFEGIKGLEDIVDNGTTVVSVGKITDAAGKDVTDKMLGKKRGRPHGSKNKPKEKEAVNG